MTILKGIVGGLECTILQRIALEAQDICFRVLMESNKSVGLTATFVRNSGEIDHIPYYLSGLSHAHFSHNLSQKSCMQ